MEWVTGIGIEARQFVGIILGSSTGRRIIDLKHLVTMGLPREYTKERRPATFDFSRWRSVDCAEYLSCFDSVLARTATKEHLVFETTHKRTRILIPALALIRGFFRPRWLLPVMFRPQALQQVCHLDLSVVPARLVIVRTGREYMLEHHGDIVPALEWMSCFPSAAQMAASVHRYALQGMVGIDLPKAMARIAFRGRRAGDTFRVTKATITDLQVLEAPFEFAAGAARAISYRQLPSFFATEESNYSTHIPLHPNGSVDLHDHEWQLIAPILLTHGSPKKAVLEQRLIFDGLLRKFAFKQAWSKVQYPVGNRNNAIYAYRKWTRQGTFQAAILALADLRSGLVSRDL
jgi:hypothetical protein